ncbi:MAG: hypothetical protein Q9168_006560 [Polycauliona sp. 1 TL-2023]
MLVVGGTKPDGNDFQPEGLVGCDTDPKFSQGLGIFSLNNHSWTTSYDPGSGAGADPYEIHSSISKVIGGNATGGASKRTLDTGFSSDPLRNLMSPPTNETAPEPSSTPRNPEPSLGKGAIAGTAVGGTISALLIITIIWYLVYRGRRIRRKDTTPTDGARPRPLQPLPLAEIYAGPVGQELRGGTVEHSLARMFRSHEAPNTLGIHEMPASCASHELSALPTSQAPKVPPPETLHPALLDQKRRNAMEQSSGVRTAKK